MGARQSEVLPTARGASMHLRYRHASRSPLLTAASTLIAALLVGCTSPARPSDPPPPPSRAPAVASSDSEDATTAATRAPAAAASKPANGPANGPVDQVVAISVDGLNPTAIGRLGPTRAPAFHRLLAQGAGTLNARTTLEMTDTLPNHTAMVTGRPVLGSPGHGVTFNEVVHDHGGSTAFYSSKTKLDLLDRTWNASNGAPDRVAPDDGHDKIDRYVVDTEAANVARLLSRLRTAPDELSFLHLAQPDAAGHAHGFMSAAYLAGVRAADTQVGRILATISADPALRAHVAVVLTADHGGLGGSHSEPEKASNYTVPFVVWGPGVAQGADLYDLNTDRRRRPGTTRPSYDGEQPVRNGEVANVVTGLLGLPDVPGSTLNRRDLLVSR